MACKWCREPDLDGGMKRLGYVESLPIVLVTHSSYMSHKRLGSKDPKRGFGCLKDKWARFECKSGLNFWFCIWGQTQGVQIIEAASQWGVRQQRRCRGTHYEGPGPRMGEEDIMYCGASSRSTNI
jgi:hypothetical protein